LTLTGSQSGQGRRAGCFTTHPPPTGPSSSKQITEGLNGRNGTGPYPLSGRAQKELPRQGTGRGLLPASKGRNDGTAGNTVNFTIDSWREQELVGLKSTRSEAPQRVAPPRLREGGQGGAIPAERGAIWGMGSDRCTVKCIPWPHPGEGAKNGRPKSRGLAWPKGLGRWDTPSIGRKRAASASGDHPGPKSPSGASRSGGLSDWQKVVPALKQSRTEELRVAARVVHGLREAIASSITTSLQTSAKPVLPHE
jgi:hypothetical protein